MKVFSSGSGFSVRQPRRFPYSSVETAEREITVRMTSLFQIIVIRKDGRNVGNVLFNDALNFFMLIYGYIATDTW